MHTAPIRAAAILTALPGREQELLNFCLEVLPRIRAVEGLQNLELSLSITDPKQLVLYYYWDSAEAPAKYMNSEVYRALAPKLTSLLTEHTLVVANLVSS